MPTYAIERDAASGTYWCSRGLIRLEKEPERALSDLVTGLGLSPHNHAQAHFGVATIMARDGYVDLALESYRKAVYYDATHAAAHYCISLLLAARGELAEAEASAREALQWEQRPEMFLHFGLVLAKEGKTQEVLDSFEEACGLSRDPAAQRRAISETLLRMQEPGLASDVLRGPGGTP